MLHVFLIARALAPAATASAEEPIAPPAEFAETRDATAEYQDEGPQALAVEVQQVRAGVSVTARFRRRDSGLPGELKIDLWNAADPIVEAEFSISGEPHMRIRQVHGDEEPQVWLSRTMEVELARGEPNLMPLFWSVMTAPQVSTQVDEWLLTLPPDPQAKNPACGAFRWGLKALTWIAASACCKGVWAACAACVVGANSAVDAINGIDCNKECKPDCPIP